MFVISYDLHLNVKYLTAVDIG